MNGLIIYVPRGAVITGRIFGVDGRPATNTGVEALSVDGIPGPRVLTDDLGVYRIFGLAAGHYLVRAAAAAVAPGLEAPTRTEIDTELAELRRIYGEPNGRPGGAPSVVPPRATRPADAGAPAESVSQSRGLSPVFYPGTTRREEASTISLSEGEERSGADFALILSTTSEIQGTVLAPDGRPAAGVTVVVTSPGPLAAGALRPTDGRTDAAGHFRIANVVPGHYAIDARLTAEQLGEPTTNENRASLTRTIRLWATAEVDVIATNINGLLMQLLPAMTMSGRVTFEAGAMAPADVGKVRVTLNPLDRIGAAASRQGLVRADGRFMVDGILPGAYALEVSLPIGAGVGQTWWPRSANADGRELFDGPVKFGAEGGPSDVIITLSNRRAVLSGTFGGPDGRPAPSFFVVVMPADPALWQPLSRRVRSVRPATDGHYAFDGLPPGDYLVAALTDLDASALNDPVFLRGLAPAGVPVHVGEGEVVRQDLRLR
jgi:hypothetical protein